MPRSGAAATAARIPSIGTRVAVVGSRQVARYSSSTSRSGIRASFRRSLIACDVILFPYFASTIWARAWRCRSDVALIAEQALDAFDWS